MGSGVATDESRQRVRNGLEKGGGQVIWGYNAKRISVEPGVCGVDDALLGGHIDPHRAVLGLKLPEHVLLVELGQHPLRDLVFAQVPELAQDVVEPVASGGA